MFRTLFRRWLGKNALPIVSRPSTFRPRLELLEERDCPAVFNIANGDIAD